MLSSAFAHLDLKPSHVLKATNKHMLRDFDAAAFIEGTGQTVSEKT